MAKKLPIKKKKKDEKTKAQEWLEKIQRAVEVKQKWRDQFRVMLGYEYWEGRQRPSNVPEAEWITINLIYSNLIAMLPTLYNMNPYFYIKLKRSYIPNPLLIALYEKRGKIRQSMINYLKEELKLKPKTRLSILDAIFQFGVMKVHHEAEMVENPDKGKPIIDEETQGPMVDEKGNALIEPESIPASEAYRITRIHPDDFVVDEDAGPLNEDVTWKAQRIKKKLTEVKEDKRYKASVRGKLKATEISDELQKQREQRKKGSVYTSTDKKEEPDTCVLWEVYHLKNKVWITDENGKRKKRGQWMVVAEGNDDFLLDWESIPKGIEDDPFSDLRFTFRDDSWYPIPPVSMWLDPQKNYCELRSKMTTHRKRFNRKYVLQKGLIDEQDAPKLETGDDGTIVWATQGYDARGAVYPIQDAPLDQSHIQEVGLLRDENTLLALGPNQRQSGRGVESATEADIIEQRLRIQEGDWMGLVIDFVREIAAKLDQNVQAHITKDQAVKVSGPQGDFWELVRTDDYEAIEGEYEYSVNVGATTPRLPEIERAQWIAFLNLIASAPQLALSKRLLKHQAELHHIDDEVLIDEIHQIAVQMMSGAMPMPGTQGSVPGQGGLPGTATLGSAMGMANIRGGP